MIKKILNKIESKRSSEINFWKFMVKSKDFLWNIFQILNIFNLNINRFVNFSKLEPILRYWGYFMKTITIKKEEYEYIDIDSYGLSNINYYFISLDINSKKYTHMIKEFKRLNIKNFEWVKAVNKDYVLDETITKIYNKSIFEKRYERTISKAEIGCFLSHINVWKEIVSKNIPFAVICEDDVKFHVNKKELNSRLKKLPKDTDIFMLDIRNNSLIIKNKIYSTYPKNKIEFKGTSCYFLTLDGAKKLIKHALPIFIVADEYLGYLNSKNIINLYLSTKPLVEHLGQYSLFFHKIKLPSDIGYDWLDNPNT